MNDRLQEIRESIRTFKNQIIQNYYRTRINAIDDPYQVRWRKSPYRILFILSHMRSGSSLLTHILNSNPEIIGYGETHLQYASESDFRKLIAKVYWKSQDFKTLQDLKNLQMNHKYILDKVLHNNKFLSDKFLTSERVYVIFLIREPQRSLPSIIDLKPDWSEDKALSYYNGRLLMLEQYARIINSKQRSLLLTYDRLLDDTSSVFETLNQFLETKTGFSEEYDLLETTGRQGVGDSKGAIAAGKIIRNPRKLETNFSPDLLQRGTIAFDRCLATLQDYCLSVR